MELSASTAKRTQGPASHIERNALTRRCGSPGAAGPFPDPPIVVAADSDAGSATPAEAAPLTVPAPTDASSAVRSAAGAAAFLAITRRGRPNA